MAQTLTPVTLEARAIHLDLIANGEQVLRSERNRYLPIVITCVGIMVITGVIVYYELQLNKAGARH
jgi:hypothetical protein